MSKHAFLYTLPGVPPETGPLPAPITGLSEWAWDVPVSYLLLAGVQSRVCSSAIWEPHIGICGESSGGINLLLRFLKLLHATGKMKSPAAFEKAMLDTEKFFAIPANRQSHILLEAGEIFSLSDDPAEQLVKDFLLMRIGPVVRDVSILLGKPPALVFGPGSKEWINALQQNWEEELGITAWQNNLMFVL